MKLGLILLVAGSGFAQGIGGISSSYGIGPNGAARGSATFHINMYVPPAVTNAPYSGEEVMEASQTLADGARITRPNPGGPQKIWRDSQGRVRTERTLGPRQGGIEPPVIVQITDPVAGFVYVLDTANRVAHRVRVEARFPGPAAMLQGGTQQTTGVFSAALPPPLPPNAGATGGIGYGGGVGYGGGGGRSLPAAANLPQPQVSTEQLGTNTIDGVLVTGTRATIIIPEGAQGNDRPMTTTNENWVSNDFHLSLLSISYSPVSGTMTRKYANFSTAVPDPSLFLPPPDYSVVDEKESFTIRWGEQ